MIRSLCACAMACLALVVTVLASGTPSAQERREGIRAGSFVVAPKVAVGTTFDSNLFRTPNRATSTLRVTLAPEIEVASDWRRHALKIQAGASAGMYSHSDADDYLDARFRMSGELDITRRVRLNAAIGVARGHDPRSSEDVPSGLAEPVLFTAVEAHLGADLVIGRIRLGPFADWRHFDFRDVALIGGGQADQDGRDRREAEAGLELGYAPGRAWELLVRANVFQIDYRQATSSAGPPRNSSGYGVVAGLRLKGSHLLEGRVTAGIVHHDYESPAFADTTTFAVDTAIDWHPTRRLGIRAVAGRTLAETAVTGASGRVSTTAGMQAKYELMRALSVGAGARLSHDRYRGIGRRDIGVALGLWAEWSMMRGVSLQPDYRFVRSVSDVSGQGHSAHVFTLLATYRLGARK